MKQKINVQKEDLRHFVKEVFVACGVPEESSTTAADVLCYADENGFDTHGVANLERIYVARLQDGRVDPEAQFRIISEAPGTAVIDAGRGLGLAAGANAMELAIAKARETGIGCVVVRNSSHFGSAGYYTQQALNAGMIGMAMTNLGAQTIARPLNGKVNMLGTNPIAMSAPAHDLPPFVLDMSTTVVATGKIRAAQRRGEPIPEGWLVDDQGQPVTDPAAYDKGDGHLLMLGGSLETGGAKGYGLALMVDILCGALSGASMGPDPRLLEPEGAEYAREDSNVGHFFLALHVDAFRPAQEFKHSMDNMLGALISCPSASEGGQVVYPGYLEAKRQQSTDTVSLDSEVCMQLERLAEGLHLTLPAQLAATI